MNTTYKYPLVEVTWDDAESDDGWDEPPAKLEPAIVTTVGFLIKETDAHILIASTYDGNHTNARIQIPKSIIVKQKIIATTKKKRRKARRLNKPPDEGIF